MPSLNLNTLRVSLLMVTMFAAHPNHPNLRSRARTARTSCTYLGKLARVDGPSWRLPFLILAKGEGGFGANFNSFSDRLARTFGAI